MASSFVDIANLGLVGVKLTIKTPLGKEFETTIISEDGSNYTFYNIKLIADLNNLQQPIQNPQQHIQNLQPPIINQTNNQNNQNRLNMNNNLKSSLFAQHPMFDIYDLKYDDQILIFCNDVCINDNLFQIDNYKPSNNELNELMNNISANVKVYYNKNDNKYYVKFGNGNDADWYLIKNIGRLD